MEFPPYGQPFSKMSEDRVVYHDGDAIRRIRGRIVKENPTWVTVERLDGTYELRMSDIIRIERRRGLDARARSEFDGDLIVAL